MNPFANERRGLMLGALGLAAQPAGAADDARAPTNLALLQRYGEAWSRGDAPAMLACYHADFTLHYFGASALAGDHVGRAASLPTLVEFSRRTRRQLLGIVDACAGAQRGMLIARERFHRGESHQDFERVFVYAFADERLRDCWVYDADPAQVDSFLS